jgi:hypothetical protein
MCGVVNRNMFSRYLHMLHTRVGGYMWGSKGLSYSNGTLRFSRKSFDTTGPYRSSALIEYHRSSALIEYLCYCRLIVYMVYKTRYILRY